jgi:hypothetical protein
MLWSSCRLAALTFRTTCNVLSNSGAMRFRWSAHRVPVLRQPSRSPLTIRVRPSSPEQQRSSPARCNVSIPRSAHATRPDRPPICTWILHGLPGPDSRRPEESSCIVRPICRIDRASSAQAAHRIWSGSGGGKTVRPAVRVCAQKFRSLSVIKEAFLLRSFAFFTVLV